MTYLVHDTIYILYIQYTGNFFFFDVYYLQYIPFTQHTQHTHTHTHTYTHTHT